MPTTCPICERRRGKRHCPGLGRSRWAGKTETICAPCCGAQREVTIDCPADCPYLVAAHRYETERPAEKRPSPVLGTSGAGREKPTELAFADVVLRPDFVEDHQALIGTLHLFLVRFADEHPELYDFDALAALDALVRTYQTLESGLYYEHTPESRPAQALAAALHGSLEQYSQEQQQRLGTSVRPGDALRALVFLRRLGQLEANGRPLSRRYLNFLRAQLPPEAAVPTEPPRLILPSG